MKAKLKLFFLCFVLMAFTTETDNYPIDGYSSTSIRRLKRLQLILSGDLKEAKPIAGAQKSIKDIKLNLLGKRGDSLDVLPPVDAELQKGINSIFPNLDESYSISLLQLTPGKKVRFAQRGEKRGYQPGSVGKLAVATALFTELNNIYPNSFAKRQELLRTKYVRAGPWGLTDEHTVPFFDTVTNKLVKRTVAKDDIFSLYEWADHMLSVSNNGAASIVWREAMLMRVFKKDYPTLTEEMANNYFTSTPKKELSDLAEAVVNDPLRVLGITEDEWRLGTFFTRGASGIVPNKGGSIGTPFGLMKFMIALERGKVVDKGSSLEIKRLLYMTDRRIRYAGSAALINAAVYFKSGSLYQCQTEEDYVCQKYMGNKSNYMNSVAIVEHPDGRTYMVCLMSNVLKKNSGTDHNALASRIDKLIR